MKLIIEREECTGCQWCADALPDVFAMGNDKIAVINDYPINDYREIQYVIDNCPAGCIFLK